jgi:hypothetical protein
MTLNPTSRRLVLLATLLVLAGGALRVWASFSAFWLDEVLTLRWPRNHGYWSLLTQAKHDNNHVLNSMFLRLVGDPDHWVWYRMLSFVTGTIAAGCMGWIAWRRSPAEGLIATILGSFTFILIHYSSEARGYGPLCCFALLSYMAIDRARRAPGWPIALAFWLTAALGVLSHSTYAFAYIGLAAWSGIVWFPNQKQRTFELLRLHLIPVVILAAVYFGRIRGMAIGGGPEFELLRVAINALSHCVGWRYGDWRGDTLAILVISLAILEVALRIRGRETERSWVFHAALIGITPLLIVFVLKPSIIYMRYLLVCVPFILLLLSSLGARLWRCCKWGRIATVVLVGLLVCLNGTRIDALLNNGRGQYLKALKFISERDPSPTIQVTGNNRVHIGKVIEFYNKYLDRKVNYVNKEDVSTTPRWFIYEIQRFQKRPGPNERISAPTPWGYYNLVKRFHYSSQSGAHWYILQHESYR